MKGPGSTESVRRKVIVPGQESARRTVISATSTQLTTSFAGGAILGADGLPIGHSQELRLSQPGHIQIASFLEIAKGTYRIPLRTGMMVTAKPIQPSDIQDITELTVRNFMAAPTFARLDPNARLAFIAINNPERLKRHAEDPRAIHAHVIRHPDTAALMAYTIVREGRHRGTQELVALGDRCHVSPDFTGLGLAHRIVELCEFAARNAGYTKFVLKISGDSSGLWISMGFKVLHQFSRNRTLHEQGLSAPFIYLEKSLI